MKKSELEKWMMLDGAVNIQIPNEIFDDLNKVEFKNFNHKCFAYAYYYLITYLYRNTVYGFHNTSDYSQLNIINVFVSNNTTVSYITKNKGILDNIGYTRTTTNYPVSCYMDDGVLEFALVKDLREKVPDLKIDHSPRLSVKEPIIGITRFNDEEYTGTFYSFQNTHKVDVKRFIDIISDKKLGHIGLLIYGYLSMMCDRFRSGYQVTNKELGEIVGCSERTIQNYVHRLEEIGCVESERRSYESKLLQKVYRIK